ncbi:MAG: tellurium resistance protein TerC [Gammaproteobacteria bacterium]|nr:tellurium resistance protein TerC [Gammaproteobacteria bacterium]
MKKVLITIVGGFLLLLGAIFIIIPGPSLLFFIPAFYILSFEYDGAKVWLKRCQALLTKSARWFDSMLMKRKLSR